MASPKVNTAGESLSEVVQAGLGIARTQGQIALLKARTYFWIVVISVAFLFASACFAGSFLALVIFKWLVGFH